MVELVRQPVGQIRQTALGGILARTATLGVNNAHGYPRGSKTRVVSGDGPWR